MASCPVCQAQVDIGSEFFGGLFTCPACRGVYFIGFDGTPEAAPSHVPEIPNMEPPPATPENFSTYESVPEVPNDLPAIPFEAQTYAPPDQINTSMEPLVSYDVPTGESPTPPTFSPLQDVIDFANSEGTKSLSSYAVVLTGLEISSNLQAFREVLIDSKLQISFEQIKSQIKNGVLRLEKLDPAQAAVIAFRLRPFPIEMKWEQSLQ